MFRLLLLIPFAIGFLAFSEGLPARGDEKNLEALKEKLFEEKKHYDAEMQKLKKSIGDMLDKREDTARKAGDKKSVDQVKAEREAFEKQSELPSKTPSTIRDPINASRTKLDKLYTALVKEYVRFKMDDAADAVEKERKELQVQSVMMLGKRAYLVSLNHFDVKVNDRFFSDNGTIGSRMTKIKYKGAFAPHSIFLHPPDKSFSQISYTLGGKWTAFRTDIGIPSTEEKNPNPDSPLTFEVLADGKSIWKSEAVSKLDEFQTCTLNVEKVKTLTLRVHCPDSAGWAMAFWLEPFLAE